MQGAVTEVNELLHLSESDFIIKSVNRHITPRFNNFAEIEDMYDNPLNFNKAPPDENEKLKDQEMAGVKMTDFKSYEEFHQRITEIELKYSKLEH